MDELLPFGEKLEPESPVRPADEDDSDSDDAVSAVEAEEGTEETKGHRQQSAASTRRPILRVDENAFTHKLTSPP